jgi:inner membrane protein
MILWHLGVGAALVYVTLGRRRIDYRFILLGAIVPDLIDGLLGLFVFDTPSGRWIAHSLLMPVAVAIMIVVLFKGERRLGVFGLAVGWLTHLVADGMWQAPRTFLWPLFGSGFANQPAEPYSIELFTHPLDHAWTWAGELVGLALLAWFWVAFDLGDSARRRAFLHDGQLRP